MNPAPPSLALPEYARDACGVGFLARIDGKPRHSILRMGLEAVANLSHRGALDADGKTGDGAGVLTQIPQELLRRKMPGPATEANHSGDLAVGMVFMPRQDQDRCQHIVDTMIARSGFKRTCWRLVPVDSSVLGRKAAATEPIIKQVMLVRPATMEEKTFSRLLYLTRRRIEKVLKNEQLDSCHIASFSNRSIVYKALVVAADLPLYFHDLRNPAFETALVVFHQRYSTNTMPDWALVQPFRMLAHNGEINTISGNRNWVAARESNPQKTVWGADLHDLMPAIASNGSDSASLDNVFELLVLSGRPLPEAMMKLIPEAYSAEPEMSDELRAFYQYSAGQSEPWDGPAAVAFSDGNLVGACLDRNGLRPARYKVTRDGLILVASEAGVLRLAESEVVVKGRLGPGEMVIVDTGGKLFLSNATIKEQAAGRLPYRRWLKENRLAPPKRLPWARLTRIDSLRQAQKAFGWAQEDEKLILAPMAMHTREPIGSMGNDVPLAVLSYRPRLLYDYFHQVFAQVTNPPIDPLREQLVMSLETLLGRRGGLLHDSPEQARQIAIEGPLLDQEQFTWVSSQERPFASATLDATFPLSRGVPGLEEALWQLLRGVKEAVKEGKALIILSDRAVSPKRVPIPALLAVAAAHHHLLRAGLRTRASIIADTGEPRSEHHFAALLGYGADAVFPYLAYAAVTHMATNGAMPDTSPEQGLARYRKAIEKGILKIMSKMGISVLNSYRGAQLFEAIGLGDELVNQHFHGTPTRLGGIGLSEIAAEALARHQQGYGEKRDQPLQEEGLFRFRKSGEYHAFNPAVFKSLHKLAKSGSYEDYKKLVSTLANGSPVNLRDLLVLRGGSAVALDKVEPTEMIMRRFSTSSMSLGALSEEAHKTLAIAMNRIGAQSGSGEGGEDPKRYQPLANGDSTCSSIKQVASGRFGVTPEYLRNASELEIKIAQGSKPGEGGQLPGDKVTLEIAALRHATPGQALISPPPHHDIYSIEDLAQLIHDLKELNPRARVSVKLVAAPGIGNVAAGVAKANADLIHISAYDGGTGASPLGSIKHAGLPWELGLAEVQQVLVANGLRGRVRLRVDSGMRTARDIIVAAALGAEEFGFGSAALVAAGCVMARQCHLNTCPVGIATQNEVLRARFSGKPEMIVNYLTAVAEEVRELLAALGLHTLDQLVGRTSCLAPMLPADHPKASSLDLTRLLAPGPGPRTSALRYQGNRGADENLTPGPRLNQQLLDDAGPAILDQQPVVLRYNISNSDRSLGTRLAGEIAEHHGDKGLSYGLVECHLSGSAGQSLGAFLTPGVRLLVTGEANDYVGKGMAGGEIVIKPLKAFSHNHSPATILGNTALYGATGGRLFAAGAAGERFAVRNSGAIAVVEGVGDHACEYMTHGLVVVLGKTGVNFAAGMTGGTAYILDSNGDLERRLNHELVQVTNLGSQAEAEELLALIRSHALLTASPLAVEILRHWGWYHLLFRRVAASTEGAPRVSDNEQSSRPRTSGEVAALSA